MSRLFVSYSHTDREPVSRIAGRLEQQGHKVWWDQRLTGGQDFGNEIESALESSQCAVVAWSSTARHSLWVRAEATMAWEGGKLVQLTLDGARPPLPFTMLHLLDFSHWRGEPSSEPISKLAESVDGILRGERTESAAPAPPAHLGGLGPSAVVGAASLGLAVLAAGTVGLAVRGVFSTSAFSLASRGMTLAAGVAFGLMLTRIVTTYLASKR